MIYVFVLPVVGVQTLVWAAKINLGLLPYKATRLSYIKSSVIQEHVKKVENQAETIRFYNYPYSAIQEALANAVYHKNYDLREPIEVVELVIF